MKFLSQLPDLKDTKIIAIFPKLQLNWNFLIHLFLQPTLEIYLRVCTGAEKLNEARLEEAKATDYEAFCYCTFKTPMYST